MQGAPGHSGAHPLGDAKAQTGAVRPLLLEQTGSSAVLLAGQSQQQVLAAHIGVTQTGGVLLSQTDGPQSSGCKTAVSHGNPSSFSRSRSPSRMFPEQRVVFSNYARFFKN